MIQYQKGKTNLDFTEARDSEWQWNQLGYTVCKSADCSRHITTPATHHSVTLLATSLVIESVIQFDHWHRCKLSPLVVVTVALRYRVDFVNHFSVKQVRASEKVEKQSWFLLCCLFVSVGNFY